MKYNLIAAALAAGLFAAPASAAVNFVTNGSFELGSVTPGSGYLTVGAPNSTAITGWTVSGGSVDYIGTYWQAADGNRSIDLNGNSPGTLSQTLTGLTVGGLYVLNFAWSANPDNTSFLSDRNMNVSIGNSNGNYIYTLANSRPNMQWLNMQQFFTATASTQVLTFTSTSTNCCWGAAIDNVSVSAVPEPATWAMMLVGFAGLGFAARRRREALAG